MGELNVLVLPTEKLIEEAGLELELKGGNMPLMNKDVTLCICAEVAFIVSGKPYFFSLENKIYTLRIQCGRLRLINEHMLSELWKETPVEDQFESQVSLEFIPPGPKLELSKS